MAVIIRVTFSDLTGSKRADVTLKNSLTANEVIQKMIDNNFLAPLDEGLEYVLRVKGSGKTIQPDQTLESAGVQENDIIVAGSMTRGGGNQTIQTDLPDDIAKKQLESLKEKIKVGESVNKGDIEKLINQIDRTEQYLTPPIPLIIPDSQDLAVRLVKADLLNIMEEYRSDENKWYSTAWAFIGAILGVIVNWLTAESITITTPAIVIVVVFGIIALLSWVSAKKYEQRAEKLKKEMLLDNGKVKPNAQ